jgi:hypothetical protein
LSGSHWQPIAGLDRGKLKEARLQAHYAAQWLARCARAYVAPRPDDGHTNLGWDDALGGFCTHPMPDGARLGLRISDLTLMLLNANGKGSSLSLDGRADSDARTWLGRECAARGLDARKLDDPSPYEMPANAVAKAAKYSIGGLVSALRDLAVWYANANGVLNDVRQHLTARGLNAPVLRCWPHHFDLDSLVTLAPDRTVGLGFSPGDEYYDEPYFYVTIYPEPDATMLPQLHMIGHWHTHEFVAAIARASKIVAVKNQKADTEAHLIATIDVAIELLR